MRLFLTLLNAGLALALQYPLEYVYEYDGSIFTGIPDVDAQASAFAFRGDMFFQMDQNGSALIKVQSRDRSEFHGKMDCNTASEFPGDFQPTSSEYKGQMSIAFLAHLFDGKDSALELTENDALAVANMKKALVGSIRNELLNSNFEESSGIGTVAHKIKQGDIPPVFTVKEETTFGICNVEYTVHKFPKHLAGTRDYKLRTEMGKDVQLIHEKETSLDYKSKSPKTSKYTKKPTKKSPTKTKGKPTPLTSIPQISYDLWHVVRSVDFDNCEESVYLQRTPVGFFTPLNGNQYSWLRGRSSVAEYILRGAGGAFRVERVDIKGTITMNSNGGEMMQTTTNLKLKLRVVDRVSEPFELPVKRRTIRTWMQEVYSPYEAPKISKPVPWVIYTGKGKAMRSREILLGYEASSDELERKKAFVIEVIEHYAKALVDSDGKYNGNPEGILKKVQLARSYTKALREDQLKEVAEHFMNMGTTTDWQIMAKKLVIDLYAATGAPYPTEIVLEYIKEKKLSALQELTIFMTLFQNQESPLTLPAFMDHIFSRDFDETPVVTSTALLNLANALRHFCISPEAPSVYFMGQLHGDIQCKTLIKSKFVPYVRELIQGDTPTWKKILAVIVLQEVKTPFAVDILAPVVAGKYGHNFELKKVALRAFKRWQLPHVVRSQAMTFLSEIFSDFALHPVLRQEALAAYVTWGPEAHFWHKLARSTWREPSKEMAAFATTVLKTYASLQEGMFLKQGQAASNAIKFARPIAPSDLPVFSILELNEHQEPHSGSTNEFGIMSSLNSPYTSISGYHSASQDGFYLQLIKIIIDPTSPRNAYGPSRLWDQFKVGDINKRIAERYYNKMQETVGAETRDRSSITRLSSIYLRAFQHIHLYASNDAATAREFAKSFETYDTDIGNQNIFGKYFHPMEGKLILPTEIGVPCISHISHSMAFGFNSLIKMQNFEYDNTVAIKIQSQVTSAMSVPAGPYGFKIGTSTISTRQINIPFVLRIQGRLGTIFIRSAYKKQFCPVIAQNTPMTFIGPLFFNGGSRTYEEKVIQAFEPETEIKAFSPLGIHHELIWKSQLPSPFSLMKMSSLEDFPWVFEALSSKTANMWQLELLVDPLKSKTKSFKFFGNWIGNMYRNYGPKDKPDGQEGQEGQDDLSQYDQEPSDIPQQSGGEFKEFGQFGDSQTISTFDGPTLRDVFVKLGLNVSEDEIIEKMIPFAGDIGWIITGKLRANEESGYTEKGFNFIMLRERATESKKQTRFHIVLLQEHSHKDAGNAKVCLDYTGKKTALSPLTTLEAAFSSKLEWKETIAVTEECHGEAILDIKIESTMNEMAKKVLAKQLQDGCHIPKQSIPFIDLLMNRIVPDWIRERNFIYNDVNYEINWKNTKDSSKHPVISKATDILGFAHSLTTGSDICSPQESTKQLPAKLKKCPHCSIHETPKHLSVKLERCPHVGHWFITAGLMQTPFNITNSHVNFNLDWINSFVGASNIVDYVPPMSSGKCFISSDKVVSLDGNTFEFTPSHCWTVAAMDLRNEDHWMVVVRKATESNIPEVRFISKSDALVIDIGSEIKVNGKSINFIGEKEEIKSSSYRGHTIATAYKKDGNFLVEINRIVKIAVTDKVIIHPYDQYEYWTSGLCGDYNFESEFDMIGPHRCYYSDPLLFAAAWTGPSDKCDLYTLLDIRKEAEKYQESCSTIESLLNATYDVYTERGLSFDWLLHEEDQDHHCVSQMPVANCKEGFESLTESPTVVDFACYHKDRTPDNISAAMASHLKYIKEPTEGRPCLASKHTISLPNACRKVLR